MPTLGKNKIYIATFSLKLNQNQNPNNDNEEKLKLIFTIMIKLNPFINKY